MKDKVEMAGTQLSAQLQCLTSLVLGHLNELKANEISWKLSMNESSRQNGEKEGGKSTCKEAANQWSTAGTDMPHQ